MSDFEARWVTRCTTFISYIGKRAKMDPEALAIVNKLAEAHAEWMASSKAEDE